MYLGSVGVRLLSKGVEAKHLVNWFLRVPVTNTNMSYSLNSLKGGLHRGLSIGDYYWGYLGGSSEFGP